jgi:hypothetical protein
MEQGRGDESCDFTFGLSFCVFLLELWIEFEFELGGESICIYVFLGLNSGFVDLFTWVLSLEGFVEMKMR